MTILSRMSHGLVTLTLYNKWCKGEIMMKILEVRNLTKIYGQDDNQVIALKDVSFTVDKGEFIAIVGVDKTTSGDVIINGVNVYQQNEEQLAILRRREVGLIYQFYNLIPVLTVAENMTLPVLLDNQKVNHERFEELIHILNLENRKNHLPKELSGGQQQRVSIGRALMNAPSIVLADEPTGNLDSKNSREIVDLLKLTQRKYKQTLIMITHDERIAMQADRIIVIEDGQIKKDEVLHK